MQHHKSRRHVNAALCRWRSAEWRAAAEREAGIPDRAPITDTRQPFTLDLKDVGFHDLRIEPRLGYIAWRARRIDTGEVVRCCALKELLHWLADRLPRTIAMRNFQ